MKLYFTSNVGSFESFKIYFSVLLEKIKIFESFMKTTLTLCMKKVVFEKLGQVP